MCTACLVVNASSVSGCNKNMGSFSGHISSPGPPALLACLLVGLPALLACLPYWPACLIGLSTLVVFLTCLCRILALWSCWRESFWKYIYLERWFTSLRCLWKIVFPLHLTFQQNKLERFRVRSGVYSSNESQEGILNWVGNCLTRQYQSKLVRKKDSSIIFWIVRDED